MRRFFAPAENITKTAVTLDEAETRHLRDVLRQRVGDEAYVMDGEGREYRCVVSAIGKRAASLEIIEAAAPSAPESPLDLTLAAAVLKADKFDLVVQKAVELGVTTLVPLETIRCDVKVKDAAKKTERWRRIALEAAKQSGRSRLMEIVEPVAFGKFVAAERDCETILFSERDGISFSEVAGGKKLTAIVGPAGGWDDAELELAAQHGVKTVTLGGRTLRAETAAIVVAAILQHRFGDLN
jgi:16S rRNA (uracil1498-N3)-methyltransferase